MFAATANRETIENFGKEIAYQKTQKQRLHKTREVLEAGKIFQAAAMWILPQL